MTLGADRRVLGFAAGLAVLVAWLPARPVATAERPQEAPADARIWIGRAAEFEDYLRVAEVVKLEDLSVGVTRPRKAHLAPGGPVSYFVWKTIRPGNYSGYRESYQFEIAAYALDKHLELNMVPPTIVREYRGEKGAAIMWVAPTQSFTDMGGVPTPPPQAAAKWNRSMVKAKIFDNLINNIDPNLGNWLVDPAWNLILVDHTRAFRPGRKMVHDLTRVDEDLWNRMKALTEESLRTVLSEWVTNGDIRGIIQRRDEMQKLVDKLVAERGEAYVFMRDRNP